jgi:hypothetical protein
MASLMGGPVVSNRRLGGTPLTHPVTVGDYGDDRQECRRARSSSWNRKCDFVGTSGTDTAWSAVDMWATSNAQLGPQAHLRTTTSAAAAAAGDDVSGGGGGTAAVAGPGPGAREGEGEGEVATAPPSAAGIHRHFGRSSKFSGELANTGMSFPTTRENGFTIEAKEMMFRNHGFECDREKHRVLRDPPNWDPTPPGRRPDFSIATSMHQDGVSPGLTLRRPYWVGAEKCVVGRGRAGAGGDAGASGGGSSGGAHAQGEDTGTLFVETRQLPGFLDRSGTARRNAGGGNFGDASTHMLVDLHAGRTVGRLTKSEHRPAR